MTRDAYLTQILEAYSAELRARAALDALCRRFGTPWPHYEQARLLERLEARTAEIMRAVLQRHGMTPPDSIATETEGVAATEDIEDWRQLTAFLREKLPGIVKAYAELAQRAENEDKAALTFLVDHERAWLNLVESESRSDDGRSRAAALAEVETLIDRETALRR